MDSLLREKAGSHIGYILNSLFNLSGEPLGWPDMERLQRVPNKLSAYLDRAQISEVRRFRFERHQYFIKTVSGTFVEVLY